MCLIEALIISVKDNVPRLILKDKPEVKYQL